MKWLNNLFRNDIPSDENINQPEENDEKKSMVDIIVETWNRLDADIIAPYLSDEFQYNSVWVSKTIKSKEEYLHYLRGKFNTIRKSGNIPKAEVVEEGGKPLPLIRQRGIGVECVLDFKEEDQKITKMLMRPFAKITVVSEKEWGAYAQAYNDFLPTALNIAGMSIQEFISKKGWQLPDFSWIQTRLVHPSFQHLCFRLGNQLYSILLAVHGFSSRGADDNNIVVFEKDYNNLLRECEKNNLIPCIIPIASHPQIPLLDNACLIDARSGDIIQIPDTPLKGDVSMSDWEINNMGIQIVVNYLEEQQIKIHSYCDVIGIEPQIWFEKDGKLSYVIVRSIPVGKRKECFPINNNLLLKLTKYYGYFADVQFASASPILRDEKGERVPLGKRDGDEDIWMWRGDRFYCNFKGLQKLEKAIADNSFIQIQENETYDVK